MRGARPLEGYEIQSVLEACDDLREETMVKAALNLGLRIGELVGLTWGAVWGAQGAVSDVFLGSWTKSRRSRSIPANDRVRETFQVWREASIKQGWGVGPKDAVFRTVHGDPLSLRQAHRLIDSLIQRAGLSGRVTSHSFRKGFASMMLDRGANLKVIQELLGHSSLAVTEKYLGCGYGNLRQAVSTLDGAY